MASAMPEPDDDPFVGVGLRASVYRAWRERRAWNDMMVRFYRDIAPQRGDDDGRDQEDPDPHAPPTPGTGGGE